MRNARAVIFANGELEDLPALRALLEPGDTLVAADGGAGYLKAMGLLPSVLIGDLDSLDAGEIERLAQAGVHILRFPVDKNETDLELALRWALDAGFTRILISAALGGRLDQTLGNIFLLTQERLKDCDVRLDDGRVAVFVIRQSAALAGQPGDTLSLLPLGGPAEGVLTHGLRYPLKEETLYPEQTRGISNVFAGASASVSLTRGLLLCVHTRLNRNPA